MKHAILPNQPLCSARSIARIVAAGAAVIHAFKGAHKDTSPA
jgi:hypothetical protein